MVTCVDAVGHGVSAPRADHLRIGPSHIRVEVRYDIAAGREAQELRALYDRDGDGWLDEVERGGLMAYLELAATHFLTIAVDGSTIPLRVVERRAGPLRLRLPSVRQLNATFALQGPLTVGAQRGPTTVTLVDRAKDSSHPVWISVAAEGGWTLLSGRLEGPDGGRPLALPLAPGELVLRGIRLEKNQSLVVKVSWEEGLQVSPTR